MGKKQQSFYTYMVECSDGSFYIGMTKDINKRLLQHNGIIAGGARYTTQRKPVQLRFYETHETVGLALKRERSLKKLPRKKKEALCNLLCIIPQ